MMKIWKAKNNYGLEVKEVEFKDIKFSLYYRYCSNLDNKKIEADGVEIRYPRYDKLMEQDKLMHPVLLTKKYESINGGLRLNVGIEKGYAGIDCIICETKDKFAELQLVQWKDASNHFLTKECMEPQGYNNSIRDFYINDAWSRWTN